MNILLTSVGRRAYLVKYFKEVLGETGEVHVSNSDDLTVAFKYADKSIISPLIYDENYIPFLLDYCKENKIDILISLFDIDLPILAKNKKEFEKTGVSLIVSDYEFVKICNDKWLTHQYLKNNNFNVPYSTLGVDEIIEKTKSGEISYPIIIKPRFGMGSIGIEIAENEEELLFYSKKVNKQIKNTYLKYESKNIENSVIYQEKIIGQEYGVDIINDLKGINIAVAVKKKLAMRAGETDAAETIKCEPIHNEAKRLGQITGHIANLDSDWFLVNNKPYVLEMNARFGGGYPFSHTAGVNLPLAIVKWYRGESVSSDMFVAHEGVKGFKEIEVKIV